MAEHNAQPELTRWFNPPAAHPHAETLHDTRPTQTHATNPTRTNCYIHARWRKTTRRPWAC